jgi:hypothetical protein
LLHEKKLWQSNERYNCNHRLLVKNPKNKPQGEKNEKQTRRVTKVRKSARRRAYALLSVHVADLDIKI